ncbi:hypothetical protein QYE76_019388 [Lolium multiflorum]|uniref:Uncharacterized protein n=1 Tax=Lolium multiflorum TaxID=4521 RepID=A0AAD8R4E8_LOLMU|nr:hypothetical protein QYE76_019388 [Lolium multiflorum]
MDLTLNWFTRRIQPLKYNKRLICEYSGVDDQLRVTKDNLPSDSLNKRIRTLVKLTRGQEVPEINKNMFINNKCPPLNSLAEDSFRDVFRLPTDARRVEEDPEDDDEGEEQAPKKAAPRAPKHPRAKVSSADAGNSGEASAKKAKIGVPPRLDSKKAERDRIKLLTTAGRGSRPQIPGATNQKVTTSWVSTQKSITGFLKTSPAIGPTTPALPSASNTAPQPTPPKAYPSPDPAAETQVKIIPVSSGKGGGSSSATKRAAPEEPQEKGLEEAEITSTEKAEGSAKDAVAFSANFGDPSDLYATPKAYSHKFFNKLTEAEKWELEQDLLNSMLNNAWGASSSLVTASSELENLRSAHQDLESKLKEAEKKRELAEKQLSEKNSEVIKEKADLVAKRRVDSDTLKKLQSELQGLRNYMTTAEKGWDLLNSDVMEPLGYDEARHEMFPRDDLIKLAEDNCRDLILACRKICHNLAIKDSRTCDVRGLIQRMDVLPELVVDLQASSAWGAAAISLAMCLAHAPDLDLDLATTGVPPDADVNALLDACTGYDTRIARRIRHEEYYDKVVLPADEHLEAELEKEREAEARPTGSSDGSLFTWTSSKDAEKNKSKGIDEGTASPAKEAEESDDDVVSSPAKEAEKKQAQADDEGCSSPTKEK